MKKIFKKLKDKFCTHTHRWSYERHNSTIIRSCNGCLKTQTSTHVEEPELCSWAQTDWKKVEQLNFEDI